MEFLHMPKELNGFNDRTINGLIDRVLSRWFSTMKSSHLGVDKKTGQWRRPGKGGARPNEDVI